MKQGSGDDPFADHDDESDESETEADESGTEPSGSATEAGGGADSTTNADSSTKERYTNSASGGGRDDDSESVSDGDESPDNVDTTVDEGAPDGQTKAEADGIPWVLRRSRVKEDRGNVHQFFLREEYSAREDEIIEEVADALEMRQKDLRKLDVREAMVAAADPEDIAAVLREWGYEYLK